MPENTIETSPVLKPPGSRSPLRSAWFLTGLVLWIFVFAGVIVLVRQRHNVEQTSDERLTPVEIPKSEPVAAPPTWDPAGIKDFTFTERDGRKVTKADLLGHPWLISFIFTRCAGPCPKVSIRMSELQKVVQGSDVRLVTLTVDPDFDTPAVLNRYADAYRADPKRWLYLTGDKRKTYQLINESFRMPVKEMTGAEREPGYEVLHSTNILLVDEKGVVVHKYNALDEAEMARLRKDLKPYLNQGKGKPVAAAPSTVKPQEGTVR